MEHITTGAGGVNRYSKMDRNVKKNEAKGMELKVFEEQYGFTYFVVSKDEISVYFVNSNISLYQREALAREIKEHFKVQISNVDQD